jgi:hypothetical protein
MANMSPVDFIKPVPSGISWTDNPRSTPWNTPPKLVKVQDVARRYIASLSQPNTINSALDVLETGIPVAALANAMMLTGVASNVHTIDTGILVIPVIIEMLVTLAEIHGVDYIVFEKDPDEDNIPSRVIKNAMKKAQETPAEVEEEEPVVNLSGLMARKSKTENT